MSNSYKQTLVSHLSICSQLHSFQPNHHLLGTYTSWWVSLTSFCLYIPIEHKTFRAFTKHVTLQLLLTSPFLSSALLFFFLLYMRILGYKYRRFIDLRASVDLVSVVAGVFGCVSRQSEIKWALGRKDGVGLVGQPAFLKNEVLRCHTAVERLQRRPRPS